MVNVYICCRSRRSSISTREGDKVDVVEAEVAELLLKYGEVVGGSRKIQGPVEVGGLAVQPSEKDTPAGSSRLHVMAWACVHYYASKVVYQPIEIRVLSSSFCDHACESL